MMMILFPSLDRFVMCRIVPLFRPIRGDFLSPQLNAVWYCMYVCRIEYS